MKSVEQQFNEWFDNKYPVGTLGNLPIMRESFKEVAHQAYIEALCSTGIRFVGKKDSEGNIQFYLPE